MLTNNNIVKSSGKDQIETIMGKVVLHKEELQKLKEFFCNGELEKEQELGISPDTAIASEIDNLWKAKPQIYDEIRKSLHENYLLKKPSYLQELSSLWEITNERQKELVQSTLFEEMEEFEFKSSGYEQEDDTYQEKYLEMSKRHKETRDSFLEARKLYDEKCAEPILDLFIESESLYNKTKEIFSQMN